MRIDLIFCKPRRFQAGVCRAAILLGIASFLSGCVCIRDVPPGATVTVHQVVLPWRSVVSEQATNISNHVEGGGQPKVAVK